MYCVYIYTGWWFQVSAILKKYELVNGKNDIPYIMENKTCLKPPTRILIVGPSRLLNNNQYLWRQVPVYIYIHIYGGNTQSPYMLFY